MSCYQEFGWTPQQVRQIPLGEAQLLAVYFEESALFQAEQSEDRRSNSPSPNANDYGMETDDVDGGVDEIDLFEAQRRAARR